MTGEELGFICLAAAAICMALMAVFGRRLRIKE